MNLWRPIPSDPHDWFTGEEIDRSRRYNGPTQKVRALSLLADLAAIVLLVHLQVTRRIIEALGVENWALQLLIAIAMVIVFTEVADLPGMIWRYRNDRRWGLSDQSPTGAFTDFLKQDILASTAVVYAVTLLVWFVVRNTDLWWLYAWAAYIVVTMGIGAAYSQVYLGATHKITRVDDPSLSKRLKRLGREAGIAVSDIYCIDASRETNRDGSLIAGMGPLKRIILFDNTLKRPAREIDVLLARKISHLRRRHRLKGALVLVPSYIVPFFVLKLLMDSPAVLRWVGVTDIRDPASFPFALLVFALMITAVQWVTNWQGRAFERQADLDSLEFTRDVDAHQDAIRNMNVHNLTDLAPSTFRRVIGAQPTVAERLALGERWRTHRLVTVLVTDVEGSTEMIERLGDERWFDLRRDHDEIVREHLRAHRGTEVDSAGDGFLLVFDDAGEALLCALDVQRALAEYNTENGTDLHVRMGLHTGEVIRSEGGVVGRHVHVAARISGQARGGEVCVSSAVHDALAGAGRFTFGEGSAVELKGLTGEHRIHQVDWKSVLDPQAAV
jgi:class 3 adenylate cyclase